MTLQRSKPMPRGTGLAPVSAKRLAELAEQGIPRPFSTFRPRADWAGLDRKPMKPSRPKPAVPRRTKKTIRQRSEGVCEMQIPDVCTWYALDASHRDGRGMGGRHGVARARASLLSNNLHACRACHSWCHARPAEAYEMGLFLKEGQIPSQEAVLYRGEIKYLDDFGGVHDFEDVGA